MPPDTIPRTPVVPVAAGKDESSQSMLDAHPVRIEPLTADELNKSDNQPAVTRTRIVALERTVRDAIAQQTVTEVECPVTHRFAHGVYIRELFVPKGTLVVAKIHKHVHVSLLMKGIILVATEAGIELLKAPMTMIAKAGTKRVAYTYEDTIWTTVHPNPTNDRDLVRLEEEIIAPTYEAFDDYIQAILTRVALDETGHVPQMDHAMTVASRS